MTKKIATRALNETFLNEFKNGKLKEVLEVIQKDGSLTMCLRGNYTTVYYRGLQILKIKQNLSFEVDKNYNIEAKHSIENCKNDWIEYFKEAKQKIDTHCLKNVKLEKEIQQIMFRENSFNCIADETDYFIIDLEYANGSARFDALAIFWPRRDRAHGKKTQLAIIEIKAGLKAIKGNASLSKHYNDVKDFIENIDKEAFLEDMKNVFCQMKDLGLINTKANPKKIKLDENIQFIFALANYNDNSKLLENEIKEMQIDTETLCSPEKLLHTFIFSDKSKKYFEEENKRNSQLKIEYFREHDLSNDGSLKERDKYKKWFNTHKELFEDSNIYKYWKEENKDLVAKFLKDFKKAYNYIAKRNNIEQLV